MMSQVLGICAVMMMKETNWIRTVQRSMDHLVQPYLVLLLIKVIDIIDP